MREVGNPSWRFAHDIDQSLHVLLYLREALGLEIEDDPIVPPRLAGEVPDHSELLDPVATRSASGRWPSWWRAVVALQVPAQLGSPSQQADPGTGRRPFAARLGLVFDPPEWASLDDNHGLQKAARGLWVESCKWFGTARVPYLPPACREVFAWEQVRDGAERAAADHDVKPGAINGCAQVLIVEGSWWQLVAPGAVLCSIGAARDPDTIATILTDVFDSYLTR